MKKSTLLKRVEKALDKYKKKPALAIKMGVSYSTLERIFKGIDPVQYETCLSIDKFLDKGGF